MTRTIEGVSVYLTESGTGSPTLFLHGAPDTAEMWNDVIERMQDHYQCFAPDLPGFGRSLAPKNFKCSLDTLASVIDALVEDRHIPTPLNLVVMDFGATYGLAWAVTHPQKIRRLAIVGGANFGSHYQWHKDARLLRTPLLGELGMASLTQATFVKMMSKNAPRVSLEYVRKNYALSMGNAGTRRMMLQLYRSINPKDFIGWEERLHDLAAHVPTLVLWGDKDPFIGPEYAERFGTQQVEHFTENGHWLPLEEPEIVAKRLTAFFA